MVLNFTHPVSKVVAVSIAIGVSAFASPAKAVEYGHINELSALSMSYESCMSRAYEAVNATATDDARRDGQGFSGHSGNNALVSIYCVRAGQGAAVSINMTYVQPVPENEIFNRLRNLFYR